MVNQPGPVSGDQPTPEAAPPRRVRSVVLFLLGTALVIGAVISARSSGDLTSAWTAIRQADPILIACALSLPALNWMLTSGVFLFLTRRYGKVGTAEMAALIGTAWLFNYLPLRPGLAGRVAYHKLINDIPVMHSVRVLAASIALGAVVVVLLLTAAIAANGQPAPTALAIGLVPLALFTAGSLVARTRGSPWWWRVSAAGAVRYVDGLVWCARYALVFKLIGVDLSPAQAAALAGVSQAVTVIPLAGNGLGVREWAIAYAASALPAWVAGGPAVAGVHPGLSADLVNRAFEMCIAIPIGLACSAFVARRLARRTQGSDEKARTGA